MISKTILLAGLALLVIGFVFQFGFAGATLATTVTTGCVTYTIQNPTGSLSSPSPWNTGQAQLLSTQMSIGSGCTLATSTVAGNFPLAINSQCAGGSACSTGTPPIPSNTQVFLVNGWLNFTWSSTTANGITGTSFYPAGTLIAISWDVIVSSASQPTGCNTAGAAGFWLCFSPNVFGKFGAGVTGSSFDFSISSTAIPNFGAGSTATSTITVIGSNSYPGPTNLVASCSSTQVNTCSVSPTSLPGGSGGTSNTATLTVGSLCCAGTFTVSVTGTYTSTSGNLVHSTSQTFTTVGGTGGGGGGSPDFTIASSTPTISFPVGGNGVVSLTISGLNGFSGAITLSTTVQTNNVGGGCSVTPTSVTLPPTASASLTLTATSVGSFVCNITGTAGTVIHTLSVVDVASSGGYTAPTGLNNTPLSYLFLAPGGVLTGIGAIMIVSERRKETG